MKYINLSIFLFVSIISNLYSNPCFVNVLDEVNRQVNDAIETTGDNWTLESLIKSICNTKGCTAYEEKLISDIVNQRMTPEEDYGVGYKSFNRECFPNDGQTRTVVYQCVHDNFARWCTQNNCQYPQKASEGVLALSARARLLGRQIQKGETCYATTMAMMINSKEGSENYTENDIVPKYQRRIYEDGEAEIGKIYPSDYTNKDKVSCYISGRIVEEEGAFRACTKSVLQTYGYKPIWIDYKYGAGGSFQETIKKVESGEPVHIIVDYSSVGEIIPFKSGEREERKYERALEHPNGQLKPKEWGTHAVVIEDTYRVNGDGWCTIYDPNFGRRAVRKSALFDAYVPDSAFILTRDD